MNDNPITHKQPVYAVRFGIGKEIQLYEDELVVVMPDEGRSQQVPLSEIKRLTLMPGEPTPSKLILMADLADDTTIVLAEGMTNAQGFRQMLPYLEQYIPGLQLDPPDMADQLHQAINNRRAWSLTCYGSIALLCIGLYVLYLIVAYLGTLHH